MKLLFKNKSFIQKKRDNADWQDHNSPRDIGAYSQVDEYAYAGGHQEVGETIDTDKTENKPVIVTEKHQSSNGLKIEQYPADGREKNGDWIVEPEKYKK